MSDTQRVQRWRERMREEGKEPISLWLSRDAKLRLEDLAALWHCSPSDLVEQALAQFRPGSASVPGTVPDTSQLQTLLAEAARTLLPALKSEILQDLQPALAPAATVPATNRNVADTLAPERPRKAKPAREYVAETGDALVTEPTPVRKGGRPRSALGQRLLGLLADHPEGLTAEQMRGMFSPDRPMGDTLAGMRRLGPVRAEGQGRSTRYFAAL